MKKSVISRLVGFESEVLHKSHEDIILLKEYYETCDFMEEYEQNHEKPNSIAVKYIQFVEETFLPSLIRYIKAYVRLKALEDGIPNNEVDDYMKDAEMRYYRPRGDKLEKHREGVNLLCPACKTKLVFAERGRFETLLEHVEGRRPNIKDSWKCPNERCETAKFRNVWLENGEGPFGTLLVDGSISLDVKYIDGNKAPFGSITRQMNAERPIYFSLFKMKGWRFFLVINPKADKNGKRYVLRSSIGFSVSKSY